MTELPHREDQDYPEGMPLPPWAADAASKITDTDHLVLIEAMLNELDDSERKVLVIARVSVVDEAGRIEIQPLGIVTSDELQSRLIIDDTSVIHALTDLLHTDDNEVEDAG